MEYKLSEQELKDLMHKCWFTAKDYYLDRSDIFLYDFHKAQTQQLTLFGVSCTFKDKVKKDIEELEQDLQELEQDLEFAYTDIEGWSYKTSIVKGAINALVKTLNYS